MCISADKILELIINPPVVTHKKHPKKKHSRKYPETEVGYVAGEIVVCSKPYHETCLGNHANLNNRVFGLVCNMCNYNYDERGMVEAMGSDYTDEHPCSNCQINYDCNNCFQAKDGGYYE